MPTPRGGCFMDHQSVKQIDFVFHLEKAIDNDEFEVYFQPVIHTISNSLCGFEALVRWHHPTLGFLVPSQFLSSLEETKQIYHLDIHIVEKVCKWYAEHHHSNKNHSKNFFILVIPFRFLLFSCFVSS